MNSTTRPSTDLNENTGEVNCGDAVDAAAFVERSLAGNEVDKWLHERVPLIHRVLRCKERFQECTFHFEFWACGSFSDESLEMLQGAAACTRKYKLGWKDGKDVRTYAARVRPKAIAEMLDQHFFAHPIARLDRDVPAAPTSISDIDSSKLIKGGASPASETPSLTLNSTVTGPHLPF